MKIYPKNQGNHPLFLFGKDTLGNCKIASKKPTLTIN